MKKILNTAKADAGNSNHILLSAAKLVLFLALIVCGPTTMAQSKKAKSPTSDEISSENNLRNFYRSYIAAANARDFDAISKVVAETVKLNGKMVKREDIITEFKKLVDAVPDFTWHLEDLLVDGDRIAARLRDTGVPKTTTFFGANSDKRSVAFTEYGSYKVENGLFVEMWYLIDVASISQQLQK